MEGGSRKFGLQLRQRKKAAATKPPLPPPALGFGSDDDEDDVERKIARQATMNRAKKEIEAMHKKALEEDSSIFDYDGAYDKFKEETARPLMQDRVERKSKYIERLMAKAKEREREHEIIYERKIQKERSEEDHLFADKDKFVTSAYKKKLAEQAKWLEEERLRELREEKDDVTKKNDLSDFYFNLNKNVAFGARKAESRKPTKQVTVTGETAEGGEPQETRPHVPSTRDVEEDDRDDEEVHTPRHQSDAKPPDQLSSGPAVLGTPSSTQEEEAKPEETPADKKPDERYERNKDAVAAARERYLARKRARVD